MSTASHHFKTIIRAAHDATLKFNHTCLRIKDPHISIPFYERHFGMKLITSKKFPEMKFDLYFLKFLNSDQSPEEINVFDQTGVLELTHNYGTENDPTFKVNNGNEEPHRGFGHICFTVNDLPKTCEKLEAEGVRFQKRMSDGRQKNIAFALDPDGYWIELIAYANTKPISSKNIFFNHTMLRVKDVEKSLQFYKNVLGMEVLEKSEHTNAKFTLYFLGYPNSDPNDDRLKREGVLELTYNWGTENDPNFSYHNGNTEPKGYGHICLSSTDPASLCAEIEKVYPDLEWAPKFSQGKMKNLAFLKDPDGYMIEIIPSNLNI